MSHVKKSPPPGFSDYLKGFESSHDGQVPKLVYNKENNQVVGDLTGKSKKIHLEKIYSKMLKYLKKNAPQNVSQVDVLYLENLKGMVTNQTQNYKDKHPGLWGRCVLAWRRIFRGDVDKLSQKLVDKVEELQKKHVDSSFSSYISFLAPLTPLDVSILADSNLPHLIFSSEKGEVICDLTGKKPENIDLEKIYTILLNYFNKNTPASLSQLDKYHLQSLVGIIQNQTADFKRNHAGDVENIGYITKLSKDLLTKLREMETLPLPLRNLEADKVKAALDHSRKEFQTVQDRFVLTAEAAAMNIKVLIKLCNKEGVQSDHPLLNDKSKLAEYDLIFEELSTSALLVQTAVNHALVEATDISKSETLAKIYKTDIFQAYVRECTLAAQAYEENLKDLIADLVNQNTFDQADIEGLNLFGQQVATRDFVYSPNDRIKGTIANCFAPPMQHIMRHAMLMEILEKNTPYEAAEYELVLEGAIEAKRGAGCMNFLF